MHTPEVPFRLSGRPRDHRQGTMFCKKSPDQLTSVLFVVDNQNLNALQLAEIRDEFR